MKTKVFPKLFYLNNFRNCKKSIYLEERINDYIQIVIYEDINSYMRYVSNLRSEYSYQHYMYILERIINYIINIYKLTYFDYINDPNTYTYETLCNIEKRYKAILLLYDISFEAKFNETNNFKRGKNKMKYKKTRKN